MCLRTSAPHNAATARYRAHDGVIFPHRLLPCGRVGGPTDCRRLGLESELSLSTKVCLFMIKQLEKSFKSLERVSMELPKLGTVES